MSDPHAPVPQHSPTQQPGPPPQQPGPPQQQPGPPQQPGPHVGHADAPPGRATAPAAPSGPATSGSAAKRSALPVITLVITALALVVGLAGVLVAAIALGRSDQAITLAEQAQKQAGGPGPGQAGDDPQAGTPPAEAPQPTDQATEPTTDATRTPGNISPTADFTIKYEAQRLLVQTPGCGDGYETGVDLDLPQVLRGGAGEVVFDSCRPGKIETQLWFAEVDGQSATPADCLERMRTAPALSPLAATKGLSLCFQTSDRAAEQGLSQKLVVMTVDSVSTKNENGLFSITLKAWDVPK